MATDTAVFTIHYPDWFDERAEWEAEAKGWLAGVVVQLADGSRYPVSFYDPVRLRQDLEAETNQGRPYIAEPGLIIVPEVTARAIHQAIQLVVVDGYFQHLKPLALAQQNGSETPR